MADLEKMDRTWLCSVLFMDIVNYSRQSVDVQMKWKARFNGYLGEAIREVPESERVILDTGDGAAVCFLGAPEAAMFAALHLWHSFVKDEREQQQGLRVRTGVNLGPVKLVKDINGSLNAIGDGMNVGQRIMSFAPENQILVSQSYFQVVSCLSDDYKALFKLKGIETDKHVREHTVYSLLPPGSAEPQAEDLSAAQPPTPVSPPMAAATARPVAISPEDRTHKRSLIPLLIGAAVVILVVGVVIWRFAGAGGITSSSTTTQVPAVKAPASQDQPVPVAKPPDSIAAVATPAIETQTPQPAAVPKNPPVKPTDQPAEIKVTTQAKNAYDEGMRLIDEEKFPEALPRFTEAIRASPNYVLAYLGRAQALRMMGQREMAIADCNQAIKIHPADPRVYFCRGLGEGLLKQYDLALRDYNEAIRRNPKFAPAYEMRGDANFNLQQYGRAIDDFNQNISLKPNNAQSYVRRGTVYESLKQYDKAIQDYDQAIRLDPGHARTYTRRANAKKLSGDLSGAAADERYAHQLKKQ
jgi:Flp pilus assembly protein TadD/class 3 adenylate cyclase